MRTRSLTPIIDSTLTFIATAILTAVLSAYFLQDMLSLIAASITVGLCVTALVKISRLERSTKVNPNVDKLMQAFIYGGSEFCNDTIKEALKKRYTVLEENGYLMVNSTAVFVDFKPRKLNHTELAQMYSIGYNRGANKLTIFTVYGLDKEAESVCKRLPHLKINVLTAQKSYAVLSGLNAIPLNKIALTTPPKKKFKEFLAFAIEPERANGYLFIAVALALSSFIMPYSFYYLLFSVLCLILGILSKADIKDKIMNRKSKNAPKKK